MLLRKFSNPKKTVIASKEVERKLKREEVERKLKREEVYSFFKTAALLLSLK